MNQLVPLANSETLPAIVTAAGENAQLRFLEFFAASIRNTHTRRAYAGAVGEFLAWCEGRGVASIAAVQPLHVAAYIEALSRARSAPTAKLRLAAIRRLFDWLVVGQVMPHNPAGSVRGPSHVVKRGKTAGARSGRGPPATRPHRCNDAGGPARPGADRSHGVQLRPSRRGPRH